ncbi:hypothetical protein M758_3G129000 [Ceratodon purpureus]|nr:hypothetical protein M758_3G129000 [Ceratodon purpureus]
MSIEMWGARLSSTSLLVAVLLVAVSLAESTEIIVGGTKGWTTGFDYDSWLTSQNIQVRVGDTLVFKNLDPLTHTVAIVGDADSYQRCVLGGATQITPIPAGMNVTVTIPATLEGKTLYAVCTIPGHCTDMQKIHGTVLAALANSTAPPPGAMTPGPLANDADMNRYICWTTAILLIAACFWNSG